MSTSRRAARATGVSGRSGSIRSAGARQRQLGVRRRGVRSRRQAETLAPISVAVDIAVVSGVRLPGLLAQARLGRQGRGYLQDCRNRLGGLELELASHREREGIAASPGTVVQRRARGSGAGGRPIRPQAARRELLGPTRRNPSRSAAPELACGGSPHSGQATKYAAAAGVNRTRHPGQHAWFISGEPFVEMATAVRLSPSKPNPAARSERSLGSPRACRSYHTPNVGSRSGCRGPSVLDVSGRFRRAHRCR